VSQAAAVKSSAAPRVATRLRCLVGFHDWPTWGVPRLVDVHWTSPAVVKQSGWKNPQHDTCDGLVQVHQAQDRVCLGCGKHQRHYFWPSPKQKRESLEFGGGGYGFLPYRAAVDLGFFSGPPPAGGDFARLGDAVLPPFRNAAWPDPSPVLLACRLGLYHIRRYNPKPRFQYERICPFCNLVFWL